MKIKLTIDDKIVEIERGLTVLETAKRNNIYIPSLCYYPGLKPYGACRLCIVEIDNMKGCPTACTTYIEDGMVVRTNTEQLQNLRRQVFELILTEHNKTCTTCDKNLRCELQQIAAYLGIEKLTLPFIDKNLTVYEEEPFFNRDYNLCILCGRCVRVCEELRKNAAVDFMFRGIKSVPGTSFNKKLQDSNCEFCGACVDICPTGALLEKDFKESFQPDKVITTLCPYCGVGCSIKLEVRSPKSEVRDEKIVRVIPDIDGPTNYGQLCVKGRFGIKEFVHHSERLTRPLVKKDVVAQFIGLDKSSDYKSFKNTDFVFVNWNEALSLIAEKFSKYKGSDIAVMSSAKCTNEENYVIQKFSRAVLKTNNIDHCARLCHAPTVVGLAKTLGSGAMTNSISEIAFAKTILSIGSNSTSTHPVIGLKIKQAVDNGAKLIIINPKKIELCKFAYLSLHHKPGTDVALLNSIAKVIVDENLQDAEFIRERCENYEEYLKSLKEINLDETEKITGVKKDLIIEAARIYATEKPATILYGMGITQHSHGTDNVFAVSNMAILTGNIGKPSTGINPLRGQNNVQGACDMGALPNVFPGYQSVTDEIIKQKFEKFYNTELNSNPGLTLTEMFKKAYIREIKAMYIIGENPILSEPCSKHSECSLTELEFLVVQDMFLTETAKLADIVLPACSFAEKDGTYTNTERRVQLLNKAIKPLGESKSDWQIVCELAKKMNQPGFEFQTPSEIMDEIAQVAPIYAGISYKRLKEKTLKWPCPDDNHPGTDILHKDRFSRGKGKFVPVSYTPSVEQPDTEFPFILTTERLLYHYHTGTLTRKVEGLNKLKPEELLEINPLDAEKLNLIDGNFVKVVSRRGDVRVRVHITENTPEGTISLSFHFAETKTNVLFSNTALDPVSKIPELKVCAVRLEKT
ncbi:MAG: formate dehydrogenase subunit alpha [Elusimicrobia bacterium]|nr:formate dehydrogenase subunit alpha [Elusimicrobiota bacterium]